MKATELMNKDWIIADGEYFQLHKYGFIELLKDYHGEAFEPIPITDDILKKNGFERNEQFDYNKCIFFSFPKDVAIRSGFGIERRNNIYYITDHALILMKYVHELQRVLRLCGLKELADNFKI